MPEQPKSEKTIEMRLAEIEDKLSQLHITEEEMKAYQKVSNALGMGGGVGAAGATTPGTQIPISRGIGIQPRICIIRWTCICPCGPGFCNECTCGPCNCIAGGSGGGFSGGFGGFGG